MNYLFIDFEYNNTSEAQLNLICTAYSVFENGVCTYKACHWLLDPIERSQCIYELSVLIPQCKVVSFALLAEARSLFTLMPWLKVEDIAGYDLQLNYKMLLNHDDRMAYGKQLIDGKVMVTQKPLTKWEKKQGKTEKLTARKAEGSLAACTYKLLGVLIDTDRKTLMRDIIISGNASRIEEHKKEIMEYCMSDIDHLPDIMKVECRIMASHGFSKKDIHNTWSKMAEYACRSALIEMAGYPVNRVELDNLVSRIPSILNSAAKRLNDECPDVAPFQFNAKSNSYIKKEQPIRDWIAARFTPENWTQTDAGQYSLSEDSFREHFRSDATGFGGAMVRYLSTKSSFNGFSPTAKKGSFFDKLGSDNRSRPFGGIYGSQTSRSQPSSTHFLPLKAKWFRYLIQPPRGRAIVIIDYASQEFLIAALLSEDRKMCAAYKSGDVYLAYGKDAGLIPKDATKETHKEARDSFKDVVLGTSYDMGGHGLATRLNSKGGKVWTPEEAQELIDRFYDTYDDYGNWKREVNTTYYHQDHLLRLSDGFTLFGDNENWRSVGNFKVQGEGAVIMRKAVANAQDLGLTVIYTLHDAIAVEYDSFDFEAPKKLGEAMTEAFLFSFPNMKEAAKLIRLDGHAWSYDYAPNPPPAWKTPFPLSFSERYVDERGAKDLQHYKHFLHTNYEK